MARTRGAKSSSPSNRKRSLRKEPSPGSVPEPAPKPSPSRPNPPPVKPAPPKPPARRYLTRSGGQPLKKKTRVESSEPIDLTEQSPEKSPNPSPVQIPVPSPVPSPEATPIPSPEHLSQPPIVNSTAVPSPAPQEKAQEPQAPIPEPQIAAEAPLEEVIEGQCCLSPQSKETWIAELGHSILSFCFDLAAFRVRPELAQSFQLLRRYHMEHLLAPRDFFYPRDSHRFYQTMTTKEPFYTLRKGSQEEASKSRLHSTPLPKAAMPSFGHLGYPAEPQLEKKRICREPFTLDKWNNMTAYKIDQPGQPQPAARRASPRHAPEDSYTSQSNLAQELAAIKACQEQMLASQAQQAAILRQLQVHFDLPQAVEPSIPTPPEPHSQPSESQAPEPEAPADPPTEEADPSA
ncbi:hypothetical protein CK203_102485 [Vitis vinifera]|uniref:Uncharacterized protein n=1 Tax=Vitis vinifera TaxID=29760 RepID=A0A438C7P5_VITVI|nr:hypothetical protein CK203_102485 [Vitis vinifera]